MTIVAVQIAPLNFFFKDSFKKKSLGLGFLLFGFWYVFRSRLTIILLSGVSLISSQFGRRL
jgi:hypothetical protein